MAQQVITPSMRAYASVLLSKSFKWAQGYDKQTGAVYYQFVSSRTDRDGNPIYHKTRRGDGACTCPGYLHRGICSHALAVQWEAEQAREKMTRRPTYEDLFVGTGFELTDAF